MPATVIRKAQIRASADPFRAPPASGGGSRPELSFASPGSSHAVRRRGRWKAGLCNVKCNLPGFGVSKGGLLESTTEEGKREGERTRVPDEAPRTVSRVSNQRRQRHPVVWNSGTKHNELLEAREVVAVPAHILGDEVPNDGAS